MIEWNETAQKRMAKYRARFMSWQFGRKVVTPPMGDLEPHWYNAPMRWADTREYVTWPSDAPYEEETK